VSTRTLWSPTLRGRCPEVFDAEKLYWTVPDRGTWLGVVGILWRTQAWCAAGGLLDVPAEEREM
jgi:hypothetical protein